ncbi:MAG: single-stranded-DNA-specific exonuclease RecJ [Desulfobacterales bacterium]|nr:MAG: single-stranded-DNA-specific exonuclease RecJ [Desulfobacterales bacterium]
METQTTYATPDKHIISSLTKALNCHPVVAGLLADRGITDPDEARFFLNPDFSRLKNPFDMKDMLKAVKRIYTALINQERILVFGDFDADGVTAVSLIYEFLSMIEAAPAWYIPHRTKEGYSLQPDHVKMAVDMDVDLIITVDCGITAHEAVAAASLEDIDVIVTDHHEPSDTLPQAVAVIDPKQADCNAGLDYLAGVGVAFYLVMALRKFFRDQGVWQQFPEPSLVNFLDLFTIGTMGDMVPLIKENRALCVAGLKQIIQGNRPGIRAMARAAHLDLNRMDADDISFKLIPRINAAGRISHARICVTHLTSRDPAQADAGANLLEELNKKRQCIEREIVQEIETRIELDPGLLDDRLLVMWDTHWEQSVLGIAASRLSKKYICPVILLSLNEAGQAVGSCRSVNHINIHRALTENAHLLEKFGGHAMAAGLTLKKEQLAHLKPALVQHLETQYTETDFLSRIKVDAELKLSDMTIELATAIESMMPFGTANPEPVFLARNLWVASSHIIGTCHRKMILKGESGTTQVEALHFNLPDTTNLPNFYSRIIFKLKVNKFKPNSVQIILQNLEFPAENQRK